MQLSLFSFRLFLSEPSESQYARFAEKDEFGRPVLDIFSTTGEVVHLPEYHPSTGPAVLQ